MRHVLRTTLPLVTEAQLADADQILRWLHEFLPAQAALGDGMSPLRLMSATRGVSAREMRSSGSEAVHDVVVLELTTEYADAFAATADRLRIIRSLERCPQEHPTPTFTLLSMYEARDLASLGDPIKSHLHPC